MAAVNSVSTGDDDAEAPPSLSPRPWGRLALPLGAASAAWALASVLPLALPAWPAASLGVLAIALGRWPGTALSRGLGTFLGVIGLLVGGLKIAALYGLSELIGSLGL